MRSKGNYFVSRQIYYYSRESVVEISIGGIDYAGSDMLVERYKGEGQAYCNPREAVEAAIEICKLWRNDGQKNAKVSVVNTQGMGLEGEPCTFAQAHKWAKEEYKRLPKCDRCGELIFEEYVLYDYDDFSFCGEYCAERFLYESQIESEETK